MDRVVGIDFDNTIVNYDHLVEDEAVRRGLIPRNAGKGKKEIRDQIRKLPNGEIEWQRVQASIYGSRMSEAELISGVRNFLQRCQVEGIRTCIISHKTEFANFDETGVNLRVAALNWLEAKGFFDVSRFMTAKTDVFFGATRFEKIDHIRRLCCTHFIDDLEEVFRESVFPECVNKILYAPHGQYEMRPGVQVAHSWQDIYGYFFDDAN